MLHHLHPNQLIRHCRTGTLYRFKWLTAPIESRKRLHVVYASTEPSQLRETSEVLPIGQLWDRTSENFEQSFKILQPDDPVQHLTPCETPPLAPHSKFQPKQVIANIHTSSLYRFLGLARSHTDPTKHRAIYYPVDDIQIGRTIPWNAPQTQFEKIFALYSPSKM